MGKGKLQAVADSLQISLSTVYAALQGRPDISSKTREEVLARARELNYRPNWLARSLVTRQTHLIGVLVPDLVSSFFTELTRGTELAAAAAGYNLLLCNSQESPESEDAKIALLVSRQVDGLIVASSHAPGTRTVTEHLQESGVPFVLVDRYFAGVNYVGLDDRKIGRIATEHLIAQGYHRIAHLRGPNVSTANGRWEGYRQALRAAGLPLHNEYVQRVDFSPESGREAALRLLKTSPAPDAIFAANDPIAIGVLQAARDLGIDVPGQLGVVGVGNFQHVADLSVPLTTIDQNKVAVGETAARLLLDLIAMRQGQPGHEAPPRTVLIEPILVVRASTQRPAAAKKAKAVGGKKK